MRLVRHLSDLPYPQLESGSVITIGAYDGLHLGHQALISRVVEEARARALPSVVMSFEPTPKEYFAGADKPARLMRGKEKIAGLKALGIDIFFCVRFSAAMRTISAADFIRRFLVHGLNARHIVVGDDFHFAHRREGNVATLTDVGLALDYSVDHVPSVVVEGQRVSSTSVRAALAAGNDELAARFLGRPYRMSGRVVAGRQLGRTLGYPTANIQIGRRQSPVKGIYAVRVFGAGESPLNGVASVGTRPTFTDGNMLLEVHLFDFDATIYGKLLHVDFIRKLRSEEKFASPDALVKQMDIDAAQARLTLDQ